MAGRKIIEALKDAASGNLSRVTIGGQVWVRADSSKIDPFAEELRRWWSFDDRQWHTHSWHDREHFIERILPRLLSTAQN